jgi:hypothetical protein
MTLVDKEVGAPGGRIRGAASDRVTSAGLRSTVNVGNKASYDKPGAAPNGADFIRLPRGVLKSVTFSGAPTLAPAPLTWKIDSDLLFSGNEPGTDETAARQTEVPADDPVLRFTTSYGLEKGFDFGYVTISADGGKTYDVVAGDHTVKGPLGQGLTGKVADEKQSYDLKAYAGKKILLGFRYVSDAAVNLGGWHLGDVSIGAHKIVSDSLDRWKSPTQWHPVAVPGWHVSLVGLGRRRATVVPIEQVAALRGYTKVVAIVALDDPAGTIKQYAPYTLTVNGVVQPGGGQVAGGETPDSGGGSTPPPTHAGTPPRTQVGTPPRTQAGTPPRTQAGTPPRTQAGTPPRTQAGTPPRTQAGTPPPSTHVGTPVPVAGSGAPLAPSSVVTPAS